MATTIQKLLSASYGPESLPKKNVSQSIIVMPQPLPHFSRCHKSGTSAAGTALLNGQVRGTSTTKEQYLAKYHGHRECVALLRDPFKRTESAYHFLSHRDRVDGYAQRADIPNPKLGFEAFVHGLALTGRRGILIRDPHIVPQWWFHVWYDYKTGEVTEFPTVYVPWDWAWLAARYERPFEKRNVSEKVEVLSWTPEMRDAHLDTYALDHELWRAACNAWNG